MNANKSTAATEPFENPVCEQIRDFAMTFPEAAEGSSCVNRAFSAGGKNFVFLGEKGADCTLRLKLADGWQKIEFDAADAPESKQIESWITESFLLLAPKKIAAQL